MKPQAEDFSPHHYGALESNNLDPTEKPGGLWMTRQSKTGFILLFHSNNLFYSVRPETSDWVI